MSRYIDADKLYTKIKTETNPYGKPSLDYESGVKVLDIINRQPTADVVEVRHGEWRVKDLNNPLYESKKAPHCSECEYMSFIRHDYCPNCGAKMYGERKDDGT